MIETLPWHENRRWSKRKLTDIDKIIIHQELSEGDIASVNAYHIRPNHISDRGCPHFCYHYGIEDNGDIIQANELKDITWHTSGQNVNGIGIMVAGYFKGPGFEDGTTGPNFKQMPAVEELVDYLLASFKFSKQQIYGHYHFGKRACPGYALEKWIEEQRNTFTVNGQPVNIERNTKELQKLLKESGFYKAKIDGIHGLRTAKAVRQFQKSAGLDPDGIPGPLTWKALINGIKPQGRTLNPCFRSRTPSNSTKLLVRRSSDSYRSEGGIDIHT